jgi:hypothetical protein
LLPNEEAFVNFLEINQKVPLQRYTDDLLASSTSLEAFLKKVHDIVAKERYIRTHLNRLSSKLISIV